MYVLTGPCHLGNWLDYLDCVVSLTALSRTQVKTLLATIHELLRLLVTMEILSGCCLDTDLHKRYLVIEVLNMWEVSMGGSHKAIELLLFIQSFGPHYDPGVYSVSNRNYYQVKRGLFRKADNLTAICEPTV
jgi:hypothetical protein